MAKPFERKYSRDQREAVEFAAIERDIKPLRRVCELAAAGELKGRNDELLPPFTVPIDTVRYWKAEALQKRMGVSRTDLSEKPPADANEALRRRLVAMIDNRTQVLLDKQARSKGREVDADELRLLARALREVAAIPLPKLASEAPKPGAFVNGKQAEGPSRGGMVGQLLREHRGEARNAESPRDGGLSDRAAS